MFFDTFPEGVIVSDHRGKIAYANAAACKLFGAPSDDSWRGTDYQQFLRHYEISDQHQHPLTSSSWFTSLGSEEKMQARTRQKKITLRVSHARRVYACLSCAPMFDARHRVVGMISLFNEMTHCYEKSFQLQQVHDAIAALNDAIARIPAPINFTLPEETLLLSPAVLCIAQQLVDMIRQVLACPRVFLKALGPFSGRIYYVTGSGLTHEQEEAYQALRGRFLLSQYLDETNIAKLNLNQEVVVSTDHIGIPAEVRLVYGAEMYLEVPLFIDKKLAGILVCVKQGLDSVYTEEEIDLVRAVAAQTALLVDCLGCLQSQTEKQAATLVLHEMHRLSDEFLSLAGHELRTPLTGIMGNIQVAQRRLDRVKRLVDVRADVSESIAHVQESLIFASQSAHLQQRMINAMIDDARIQAHTLQLNKKRFDLLALLREIIVEHQRGDPDEIYRLEIASAEQEILVLADAGRIKQVFSIYLENAQLSSPADQPVTVHVAVEGEIVRVLVHDEGAGIPLEEQEHLWERFYRAKGSAVQHELNLSLGLGFYLCHALIELHQGEVGLRSTLGHGTTFWFTLPIATPALAS